MRAHFPGSPRGVGLKSKAPWSWAWADNCGLTLEPRSKLSMIWACSRSRESW
jgi:hypothetical protein